MKRYILIITLGFFAVTLQAQQNKETYSRSITKFGGAFTVGDTFTMDNLGFGFSKMTYQFFDPFTPWGFYYGLCGIDITHTVGGVTIDDIRPVTIGWRKEVAGNLGFDLSLSPVLGSRIIGNTIYGKLYLGVKPTAGTYLVINDCIDVELAYEPVINLADFSGSEVSNKTYHDFSLYIVLKKFSLIKELGWHSTAP